jgi:hypothetical protein
VQQPTDASTGIPTTDGGTRFRMRSVRRPDSKLDAF